MKGLANRRVNGLAWPDQRASAVCEGSADEGRLKRSRRRSSSVVGLVIGWLVAGLYAELVSLPAGERKPGQSTSAGFWRPASARPRRRRKPNAGRRNHASMPSSATSHQREAERLAELSNLEAALDQEANRVPIPSAADRGAVACRPCVPRGCATRSTVSVAPRLATIPQALLLPCANAVALPERDLTTAETVRLWGRDRQALGACRDRHSALALSVGEIQSQGVP